MQPDRDPTHPRADETAVPDLPGPATSSRIPPSEPGPYGQTHGAGPRRRRPTLTGQILYLGGAGIIAAAATAAIVLAGRKLMAPGGDPAESGRPPRERGLAPRFAEMDEEEREEIRRRVREQARADQNRAARLRAAAARDRLGPRRNVAQDLTETASDLSGSIHGVMGALTSALSGFRQVAGQASGIIRDFSDAADAVTSLLDRPGRPAPRRDPADGARAEDARPRDRTHRL